MVSYDQYLYRSSSYIIYSQNILMLNWYVTLNIVHHCWTVFPYHWCSSSWFCSTDGPSLVTLELLWHGDKVNFPPWIFGSLATRANLETCSVSSWTFVEETRGKLPPLLHRSRFVAYIESLLILLLTSTQSSGHNLDTRCTSVQNMVMQ